MKRPQEIGRCSIELGGELIEYTLRRSNRKTLGITVEPDGGLLVTAPWTAALVEIESVLRRRRGWIRRHRRETAALPPPAHLPEWVSGETHRYLGRQYRLKVEKGEKSEVRLLGRFFRITVPDPTETVRIRKQMERWYLDRARSVFGRRLEKLVLRTPRLRLKEAPSLIVRKLQRRWGSCSPNGRILMNVDAVKLSVGCIDYLLLHELCHLRVPNHGPAFWRFLDACMPDWEYWRRRLEQAEI